MVPEDLNALDRAAAVRDLLRCCGSTRWAEEMADRRPFRELEAIEREADRIWLGLERADWLEAFAAHPRIGESPGADRADRAASGGAGQSEAWAACEQAGMTASTGAVRQRLAAANRDYEARFGFVYIMCATGKTADEMLANAEGRVKNAPDEELRISAEEQRQITRLRLRKLFASR